MIAVRLHIAVHAFGTVTLYVRPCAYQAVPVADDQVTLWGNYADGDAELWPIERRSWLPDAIVLQLVPMFATRSAANPPRVDLGRPPGPRARPWNVHDGDPEAQLRAAGWITAEEYREVIERVRAGRDEE